MPANHQPKPVLHSLTLTFAISCIFLYLRVFTLQGIPFLALDDQVLFFVRATRLLHGQTLYRDIFELVPPATDLLYAVAFRLFGIHSWVPAAIAILLGAALATTLTWLSTKLLRGPSIFLPALLFLTLCYNTALDPTHHWYSTLFALLAAGTLMESITTPRLIAAGTLTAIATLFTQTQGALALAALLLWLLLTTHENRRRNLAALLLPYTLLVAAVLDHYARLASWHTLFFDLVTFPLRYLAGDTVNSPATYLHQLPPLHTLADLLRLLPALFIYALVPYLYLVALWHRRSSKASIGPQTRHRILLLSLVGLTLALAVASGPRLHRLCTVAPPAIPLLVWLLSANKPYLQQTRRALTAVAILFAAALAIHRQHAPHTIVQLPIGRTAFLDRQSAAEYTWLAQHTHPGDLFLGPGGITLYLHLTNPTPADYLNDSESTRPQMAANTLAALQQHPPRYILLQPLPPPPTGPHDHTAPIRVFVHQHYRLAQTFPLDNNFRSEQLWELQP